MSGGYGYPPPGPQPAPVTGSQLVAAVLLVLAAVLALGGSFGALSVYRFESELTPASTTTTTGWDSFEEPAPEEPLPVPVIRFGIPLAVAAVLALVAALLLVLSVRRPRDPGVARSLGVGAAGLLVGVVSVIWLQLVSIAQNVAAAGEQHDPGGIRTSYEVGAGGYLVLAAAVLALVAAALLLVPRRAGAPVPVHPGPATFPALGPGPQPPWPAPSQAWPPPQPPTQHWPPPGPGAPPPGWGPPPHQG